MKPLKNWDNKTWLSSNKYINSFNSFLLKKKNLNKNSKILDIGCGRGKIFGILSKKLRLVSKPTGVDPVLHKDVNKLIDFRNEDIFQFFKTNQNKFDLIMIKQTLHFFNKDKRIKLIKICKNSLKKNGVLLVLSLNTINNEIPCFKLMKQKLNRGLNRDSRMLKSIYKILKNHKISRFEFKVSITKKKIYSNARTEIYFLPC
jgi:ubiquinone/menaquinone biosynthesis C-methylase UbiE